MPGGIGQRPGGSPGRSPSRPGGGPSRSPSRTTRGGSPTRGARGKGKAKPQEDALLSLDTRLDILGIGAILVALVTLLSFLSKEPGTLILAWLTLIKQAFGWGAYAVPVFVGGVGVWLIWRHFGDQLPPIHPVRIIGGVLLFLGALTLMQAVVLAFDPIGAVYFDPALTDPSTPGYTVTAVWDTAQACPAQPQSLIAQGWRVTNAHLTSADVARCGYGGGFIGAVIQTTLTKYMGSAAVFVLALAALVGGSLMLIRMTLKDALHHTAHGVQWVRDRRRVMPTAFKRNAKGELVPIGTTESEETDEKVIAPSRGKPGAAKEDDKSKEADKSTPQPAGRPSIVDGRLPAGSKTEEAATVAAAAAGGVAVAEAATADSAGTATAAPPRPGLPGAPAGGPPSGPSGPNRPGTPGAPSGAPSPASGAVSGPSLPPRPGAPPSAGGTPAPGSRPGVPGSTPSAGERPGTPGGIPSSSERPGAPGGAPTSTSGERPAAPGGMPGASGLPRPGAPGLPGSRPGLPGTPAGATGSSPLPRPGGPPDRVKEDDEDNGDDNNDDNTPGGTPSGSPSGGSPPGADLPRPGFPPRPGVPGSNVPGGSSGPADSSPSSLGDRPGMSALPRPSAAPGRLPPVGTPPGANRPGTNRPGANRTFGPPPPSSLGGPRPAPKPGSPAAGEDQKDAKKNDVVFDDVHDDLDVLRNAIDLSEDEKMPPTDQIIKELVEDDAPKTPAPNGGTAGKPEPPKPPALSAASASPDKQAEEGSKGAPGDRLTAKPDRGNPAAPVATATAAAVTAAAAVGAAAKPPAPPPDTGKEVKASAEAAGPAPGKPPRLEIDKKAKPDWVLPDIDKMLKNAVRKSISDEELRHRAEVIEQTLSSFGAPGRVVEVNHGPVITQFGVEPDYIDGRAGKRIKVKVGKIGALADDLALALAAPSIRIEAPVPGKGYVGVEVPNAEPSLVGLRDVMDTPEFRSLKSPLKLALGQDVSGQAVVADLTGMPHLLIAGTTGSGKSVCVNGIICTMLMTCSPDELKLIMVDPKRVELTNYNGIPHLMAPVVTELERIVGVLKWVQREMDDRYRAFAMAGARNITDYNGRVEKGQLEGERLPYIIVIVDELADLMMLAPDETERVITRLAQMARATGIHIIISTQRPSVDVVTGLIKANFPSRIAFAVATGVDSRVIMDMPGAEKLLGRGDMLFQAPDAPMPLRLQGIFVSDEEIQKIVDYWREEVAKMPGQPTTSTLSSPPTSGVKGAVYSSPVGVTVGQQKELFNADDDADEDVDDLFDEAVELVRGMEKASISLLQRHLRIGYTRAARLIDLMEEREVIGPHAGGSKPREVLDSEDEGGDDSEDDDDTSDDDA